ncbi:MAG: phage tail length tape measure family protein [Methanobrevibacter sp.]|nr:phage tail length tape measure family protein [Methanobrevibacter sp.]
MAEELSRIGIAVDSKQAENSLNNIKNQLRSTAKDVKLFDEYWDKLNSTLYSAASGFTSDNALLKQMATDVREVAKGVNQLSNNLTSLAQKGGTFYKQTIKKTIDPMREMTKTMNDMAKQANRFNFGNINAQLQDIIVTSQMGMRPLSIGLQQGTQLVYILQQSKAPLADFKAGLKSLISPLSLTVVGLTTLVAVGIQMVDWVNVGKNALNKIADVFDYVAEKADVFAIAIGAAGVALTLFNNGVILKVIKSLWTLGATALVTSTKMVVLWMSSLGPIGLVIAAIGVLTGLFLKFEDNIKSFFSTDFGKYVKIAINGFIGFFVGAIDVVVQSVMWAWQKIQSLWGGAGPSVGFTETIDKAIDNAMQRDYFEKIGKASDTIKSGATAVADKFRDWSKHLGESDKNAKKLENTIAGLRKEYEDLAISYQTKISDMQFEKSTRGLTDEQKLVAQINHEYDQEIAKLERKVALKQIDTGLFAKEKAELDKIKEGLIENSLEQDRYNESVKNFNAVMDYSSSVTKGFFSDLKKGLKDGESAWESFTNAVINMLDKIQDKILDLAIDQMFNSLKQSNAASGSSNWLSGIINAGVSWVSGSSNVSVGQGALNAMGGQMGVKPTMTANGGVFSNGIYSSPTVFQFAKGGKFGVMGEAGPEAVMPLRRTSDGSLGVKAEGVGGSNVVVNVINNSNAQARTEQRQTAQGMEIDVMIDEMVAEKMARPGTASNSALRAYNNQQLITR